MMPLIAKKKNYLPFFSFLFLILVGCSSIPTKVEEEGNSSNAFFLTKENIVFAHIEPHRLKNILSGLPGTLPLLASQKISSAYIDYSTEDIRVKLWGDFPKNWINASLWDHRYEFTNESTLRETRFKNEKKPLYISIPNRSLVYVSSKEFYSVEEENKLKNNSSEESLNLISQSQKYPLFFQVKNLKELLSSLKIELPAMLRLPFNFIEVKLVLKESKQTELTLTFGSDSKETPPSLAVRFALNYVLGQYPDNPLTSLWKKVPITINPENPSQVVATLELSENDLKKSLGIIYSGYLEEKSKSEKDKKEKEKQNKAKEKSQNNPVTIYEEIISEDSLEPLLE